MWRSKRFLDSQSDFVRSGSRCAGPHRHRHGGKDRGAGAVAYMGTMSAADMFPPEASPGAAAAAPLVCVCCQLPSRSERRRLAQERNPLAHKRNGMNFFASRRRSELMAFDVAEPQLAGRSAPAPSTADVLLDGEATKSEDLLEGCEEERNSSSNDRLKRRRTSPHRDRVVSRQECCIDRNGGWRCPKQSTHSALPD